MNSETDGSASPNTNTESGTSKTVYRIDDSVIILASIALGSVLCCVCCFVSLYIYKIYDARVRSKHDQQEINFSQQIVEMRGKNNTGTRHVKVLSSASPQTRIWILVQTCIDSIDQEH